MRSTEPISISDASFISSVDRYEESKIIKSASNDRYNRVLMQDSFETREVKNINNIEGWPENTKYGDVYALKSLHSVQREAILSKLEELKNSYMDMINAVLEDTKYYNENHELVNMEEIKEELYTEIMDWVDRKVKKPIVVPFLESLELFEKKVFDATACYFDINTFIKKLKKEKGFKRITEDQKRAFQNLVPFFNTISGATSMEEISGMLVDSMWPLLNGIKTKASSYKSLLGGAAIASHGIGNILSTIGYFTKNNYPQGFGYMARQIAIEKTTTNGILGQMYEDISQKHLHAIMPKEAYFNNSTLFGMNNKENVMYINQILESRPTVTEYTQAKTSRLNRIRIRSPGGDHSSSDRWLRCAYVKVKIPIYSEDGSDTTYKNVWGIRIVIGGPSKQKKRGEISYEKNGTAQNQFRHVDTFRKTLLINFSLKQNMIDPDNKSEIFPTEKSPNLFQLVYTPPRECTIDRFLTPLSLIHVLSSKTLKDDLITVCFRMGLIHSKKSLPKWIEVGTLCVTLYAKSFVITSIEKKNTSLAEKLNIYSKNYFNSKLKNVFGNQPGYKIFMDLFDTVSGRARQDYEEYLGKLNQDLSTEIGACKMRDAIIISRLQFFMFPNETYQRILRIERESLTPEELQLNSVFAARYHADILIQHFELYAIKTARQFNMMASTYIDKTWTELSGIEDDRNLSYKVFKKITGIKLEKLTDIETNLLNKYPRSYYFSNTYWKKEKGSPYKDISIPLTSNVYARDSKGIRTRKKYNSRETGDMAFRFPMETSAPPVMIVLFDSGAPPIEDVHSEILKQPDIYEHSFNLEENFAENPMHKSIILQKETGERAISYESTPMEYDMNYDVDGYVDLEVCAQENFYPYSLEELNNEIFEEKKITDDMTDSDILTIYENVDSGLKDAIPKLKNLDTYLIEERSSTRKTSSYFSEEGSKRIGLASKKWGVCLCDIRSLISRSGLSGYLHDVYPDSLQKYETLSAIFRKLQWPNAPVRLPTRKDPSEITKSDLICEVIAQYDTNLRFDPKTIDSSVYRSENLNKEFHFGYSMGTRTQVSEPTAIVNPSPMEKYSNSYQNAHPEHSFPGVFKFLDTIDLERWKNLIDITNGANPNKRVTNLMSYNLTSDHPVYQEIGKNAYMAPRKLPVQTEIAIENTLREHMNDYLIKLRKAVLRRTPGLVMLHPIHSEEEEFKEVEVIPPNNIEALNMITNFTDGAIPQIENVSTYFKNNELEFLKNFDQDGTEGDIYNDEIEALWDPKRYSGEKLPGEPIDSLFGYPSDIRSST